MRFALTMALMAACLVVGAEAQKQQKPKSKPTYTTDKSSKGSSRSVRLSSGHNNSAQELHRLEQSSAKTSAARRGSSDRAPRTGAVVRAEKQERNPPIHFASGQESKGGKGKKGGDPYKGRLRHKGSHR